MLATCQEFISPCNQEFVGEVNPLTTRNETNDKGFVSGFDFSSKEFESLEENYLE